MSAPIRIMKILFWAGVMIAVALPMAANAATSTVTGSTMYAYGESRDASTVPTLIAALQDQDPQRRRIAARALGKIRDPRAIAPPHGAGGR